MAPEPPGPPAHEPGEAGKAVGSQQPVEGASLSRLHPVPTPQLEHPGRKQLLQPVEVIGAARPGPRVPEPLEQLLARRSRLAVGLGVADDGAAVLDVVVEGVVDVADVSERECDDGEPTDFAASPLFETIYAADGVSVWRLR